MADAIHFTTSEGVDSSTRTTRRFVVVSPTSGRVMHRSDERERAAQLAERSQLVLEVIDLETQGRRVRPRGAQPPEPAGGWVVLAGMGRVHRRHLPGAESGTLCHPEADVEPARSAEGGALCKTCADLYFASPAVAR